MNTESPLRGYYYALSALSLWGLFPVFWKLLATVDALEILAHRTLWSGLFIALILAWKGKLTWVDLMQRNSRQWLILSVTSVLIASNWGLFVWAVNHDKVIEASMGYFLSPLISILLAKLIFSEHLKPIQAVAIGLAVLGVAVQVLSAGVTPWTGLLIALSFSGYAALRKLSSADTLSGLFIETLILGPVAFAYLFFLATENQLAYFNASWDIIFLLSISGAVTVIPLMLYVASVRLLDLSVVSFLFYLNPTIQFLLGVVVYNEPFTPVQLVSFMLIWMGLIIYTYDNLKKHRKRRHEKTL